MTQTRYLAIPLLLIIALLGACSTAPSARSTPATPSTAATVPADPAFAKLERQFGARLGVYAMDTGTGRTVAYRADERFAYDSTFKVLVAGILLRTDSDADLAKVITYTPADLLSYAPITKQHVSTGMNVRDLIAAAVQYSDNTAADLLLKQIGGPTGLQAALRGLGDSTIHADRAEPDLNTGTPGDIRDTSTPRAMGTDLREFVLGNLLTGQRRTQLIALLQGNTTGGPFIRAGVPAGWKVGDKTGNGDYGTRNDIAIVWPPTGSPLVISLLSTRRTQNATSEDALLADATKAAVSALR